MMKALWAGVAVTCLAGLLLYGFGTNNPNALRWFVFSCAAVLCLTAWTWNRSELSTDGLVWAVVAFVSYAALSLAWSADWREGVLTLNQLVIAAILFLTFLHVDRGLFVKAASLFAISGVAIELFTSFKVSAIFGGLGNENFQSEFLVVVAPMACLSVVAFRHPLLRILGAFACMAALMQAVLFNPSDAKWAGFSGMAGLAFLALIYHRYFKTAGLIVLGSAAGIAAIFDVRILTSFRERFELGYDTFMMWKDNPIFGVGIGSFNYKYPFYQEAHIHFQQTMVVRSIHNFAGAAHNEFLQALAVFGLAGAGLLTTIACLAYARRQTDMAAWFGGASLFAFAGLSLVGFPAQNPSTIILGLIAVSLVTKATHAPQNSPWHGLPPMGFRGATTEF